MQFEKIIEKKDEEHKNLLSKITPLQKFVDDLTDKYKELQALHEEVLKIIKEKDKQLQRLELIEHQYQQLQRLMYARSRRLRIAVLFFFIYWNTQDSSDYISI